MTRASQRRSIRIFRDSSDIAASLLCLLDITLFLATLGCVVLIPNSFVKVIAALGAGLMIARLFVLGHDACHQSLFANRLANRWMGRLIFLPSLTPYSLWEVGHNLGHHVYTNLRGMDYIWTPLTKQEFDALPWWRRQAERCYRSGWGHGAYYLIELWWKKLFFASRAEIPNQRAEFTADSMLVLGFATLWIAGLAGAAFATDQSALLLIGTGFVLPFLVWNCLMGSVIYFHHTHPQLPWYDDIDRWEAARDTGPSTIHIEFGHKLGRILNNIMTHPAHHLDVRIPLYRLEAAQRALAAGELPPQRFTFDFMRSCIRVCKLYDYEAQRWTDFAGRPTSATLS